MIKIRVALSLNILLSTVLCLTNDVYGQIQESDSLNSGLYGLWYAESSKGPYYSYFDIGGTLFVSHLNEKGECELQFKTTYFYRDGSLYIKHDDGTVLFVDV